MIPFIWIARLKVYLLKFFSKSQQTLEHQQSAVKDDQVWYHSNIFYHLAIWLLCLFFLAN